MSEKNEHYVIDWDNPLRARDKLKSYFYTAQDFRAMQDALAEGWTARECAEAWIQAYVEAQHYVQIRDEEGRLDDFEAAFTNDVERCIDVYESLILAEIEERDAA